jgi:WXG100 family type VII secretion target
MADQIRVTFGSLDNAVGDIAAGVAAQGQRLQELKADIAPMVATWEGSAQTAYYAHQQKWDAAWQDLTDALQQFQGATDRANADYAAGERANTASWG